MRNYLFTLGASLCFMLCLSLPLCLNAQNKETLTNQSVISLVKAGLDKSTILATVNNAPNKFDVSSAAIISLKKQGVTTEIINAMIVRASETPISPAKSQVKSMAGSSAYDIPLANHPYLKTSSKVQPLEKAVAGLKIKRIALGYGGTTIGYQIDGAKASVRAALTDSVYFLINTGGAPLPDLMLYKLEVKKEKRFGTGLEYSVTGEVKPNKNSLAFTTSIVGAGIYKINTVKKLEAGEYFFGGKPNPSAASIDVYTFGIE